MFKRALAQDERSKRLRDTIEDDDNLNLKQKRRLLNSLLSTAVLTVDEMNELEVHSDSELSDATGGSEQEAATTSDDEPIDENAEIFKDKTDKNFRLCRYCPGRKMLTDDDVRKHVESKTHLKRKLKQTSLVV